VNLISSPVSWEALAVLLGILYLLLAMWEKAACWYAAFFSTLIFLFLFQEVNLLMESALQVYYLAMAVYGWWQWQHGGEGDTTLRISRWGLAQHARAVALVLLLSGLSGWLLSQNTGAMWPYLDSFTTWGAVLTTWMVARKILENWLYWLVIDSVSIFLYIDRGLFLTAALFAAYVVIVIFGFVTWTRHYRTQSA
jgi:nicotinamide mononucleotide transporter